MKKQKILLALILICIAAPLSNTNAMENSNNKNILNKNNQENFSQNLDDMYKIVKCRIIQSENVLGQILQQEDHNDIKKIDEKIKFLEEMKIIFEQNNLQINKLIENSNKHPNMNDLPIYSFVNYFDLEVVYTNIIKLKIKKEIIMRNQLKEKYDIKNSTIYEIGEILKKYKEKVASWVKKNGKQPLNSIEYISNFIKKTTGNLNEIHNYLHLLIIDNISKNKDNKEKLKMLSDLRNIFAMKVFYDCNYSPEIKLSFINNLNNEVNFIKNYSNQKEQNSKKIRENNLANTGINNSDKNMTKNNQTEDYINLYISQLDKYLKFITGKINEKKMLNPLGDSIFKIYNEFEILKKNINNNKSDNIKIMNNKVNINNNNVKNNYNNNFEKYAKVTPLDENNNNNMNNNNMNNNNMKPTYVNNNNNMNNNNNNMNNNNMKPTYVNNNNNIKNNYNGLTNMNIYSQPNALYNNNNYGGIPFFKRERNNYNGLTNNGFANMNTYSQQPALYNNNNYGGTSFFQRDNNVNIKSNKMKVMNNKTVINKSNKNNSKQRTLGEVIVATCDKLEELKNNQLTNDDKNKLENDISILIKKYKEFLKHIESDTTCAENTKVPYLIAIININNLLYIYNFIEINQTPIEKITTEKINTIKELIAENIKYVNLLSPENQKKINLKIMNLKKEITTKNNNNNMSSNMSSNMMNPTMMNPNMSNNNMSSNMMNPNMNNDMSSNNMSSNNNKMKNNMNGNMSNNNNMSGNMSSNMKNNKNNMSSNNNKMKNNMSSNMMNNDMSSNMSSNMMNPNMSSNNMNNNNNNNISNNNMSNNNNNMNPTMMNNMSNNTN